MKALPLPYFSFLERVVYLRPGNPTITWALRGRLVTGNSFITSLPQNNALYPNKIASPLALTQYEFPLLSGRASD